MKIYQALKRKNLLVGEINELIIRIRDNNSLIKGNKKVYDIDILYEELLEKQNLLIVLKTALQITNSEVYSRIFRLSELKSLVNYLKETPANDGKEFGAYRESVVEYECSWSKKEIDKKVKEIKRTINKIQEELELFNFTTDLKGYIDEN